MLDMNKDVTRDEDGNRVQKTEKDKDGKETTLDEYEYTNLTDDQKEAKKNTVKEIEKALKEGADFAELIEKYSDSFESVEHAKAYIISKDGTLINTTVQEKVKDFKVGDYTEEGISYSNDNYTYFVKKVELPVKAYEEEEYEEFFTSFDDDMKDGKYSDMCDEYVDKIVVNDSVVSKYSFVKAFLSDYVNTRYQSSLN